MKDLRADSEEINVEDSAVLEDQPTPGEDGTQQDEDSPEPEPVTRTGGRNQPRASVPTDIQGVETLSGTGPPLVVYLEDAPRSNEFCLATHLILIVGYRAPQYVNAITDGCHIEGGRP
ncbi:hypothetical protein LTR50_006105 [Elasticomyces elasticus]|nr:hypothetical protein LTR50_006105 [Elasticomyces elasticus]